MSEQITDSMKSKKKIYKRWWFWTAIGFVLLFVIWLLSPNAVNPKLLNVDAGEQLSIAGVISGISRSAADGSGEITNFDCKLLSDLATRNEGNFYGNDVCEPGTAGFIAKSDDTAQSTIVSLYPSSVSSSLINCDTPIATYTFNLERTELLSYSFDEKDCFQGAELPISSVNVTSVQELSSYADKYEYKRK
ncbi:MAG: hypothetical protein WAR37_01405 [Candidatus Microsaccharimonas sp.]